MIFFIFYSHIEPRGGSGLTALAFSGPNMKKFKLFAPRIDLLYNGTRTRGGEGGEFAPNGDKTEAAL